MSTTLGTLAQWQEIVSDEFQSLVDQAVQVRPGDLQAITRLRKQWPAEHVALAIELQEARRRGRAKFPDHRNLVADVDGMQQATPWVIAMAKAARFTEQSHVLDGCCGIGGDAMALAERAQVTAVDINPVRCWMTERNAQCESRAIDLALVDDSFDAFHIDPARRDAVSGRRLHDPEQWRPSLASIEPLRNVIPDGVIKLGPGVDIETLSRHTGDELEFCSLNGSLAQAHLWCGSLATAPGQVRATRYPGGDTFVGTPAAPPWRSDGTFDQWLVEADPALERARLHGIHGAPWNLEEPCPGLGLLTGPLCPDSNWLTIFEVLDTLPWRIDRVHAAIRSLDPGVVEVKTRDGVVNPDPLQRRFSGTGTCPLTLFVLRCGRNERAIITRRVSPSAVTRD